MMRRRSLDLSMTQHLEALHYSLLHDIHEFYARFHASLALGDISWEGLQMYHPALMLRDTYTPTHLQTYIRMFSTDVVPDPTHCE